MTYNVFGGMLNLTQPLLIAITLTTSHSFRPTIYTICYYTWSHYMTLTRKNAAMAL